MSCREYEEEVFGMERVYVVHLSRLGYASAGRRIACRFPEDDAVVQLTSSHTLRVVLAAPHGLRPAKLLAAMASPGAPCVEMEVSINFPGRADCGASVEWTLEAAAPFRMSAARIAAVEAEEKRKHRLQPWPYGTAFGRGAVLRVCVSFAHDTWPRPPAAASAATHPMVERFIGATTSASYEVTRMFRQVARCGVVGAQRVDCVSDAEYDAIVRRLWSVRCRPSNAASASMAAGMTRVIARDGWTFLVPVALMRETPPNTEVRVDAASPLVAAAIWLMASGVPAWDPNLAVDVLTALGSVRELAARRDLGCREALGGIDMGCGVLRNELSVYRVQDAPTALNECVYRAVKVASGALGDDEGACFQARRLADLCRAHELTAV
jgi:hypothetical protein